MHEAVCGVRQRGQGCPSPDHPTTCTHIPRASSECSPKQQCQRTAWSQAATTCRGTPSLVSVIYEPLTGDAGCKGWHWHLPGTATGSASPSEGACRAPSSPWAPWGGFLSQPECVTGRGGTHPVLVLGTGTARGQRAPHPSQGSARCRWCVLPASPPVMGAGCPAGPIPPSPSLGAHRQERGAVPALGLLLPVFTCSDSHHVVVHPRLPALVLQRCQALPGRSRVLQAGKDKTPTYPTLPPPLPLPTGPKARGFGSCPTLNGCPEPPRPAWTGGCPGWEWDTATAPALAAACSL